MTEQEIKAKWLKKDRKVGRYVLLAFLVVIALACIFWEYTIIGMMWIHGVIYNSKNRFHTFDGKYLCVEDIKIRDDLIIDETYFVFTRISYDEYEQLSSNDNKNIMYIGPRDKDSFFIVKAFVKFAFESEYKEYATNIFYYHKNEAFTRNGPTDIEIIIDDYSCHSVEFRIWSDGYNLKPNKKYKSELVSIECEDEIIIWSMEKDEKGNYLHDYNTGNYIFEYQGNIE